MPIVISMSATRDIEKRYVLDVVFREFLGLDYDVKWKDETDHYEISLNNKLISLPDVFFREADNQWLKESSLPVLPLKRTANDVPVLYGDGEIDIFGSIFFALTRYEEMCIKQFDSFERFDYKASVFYKEKLVDRPLVNEYLELLKNKLASLDPSVSFKQHRYTVSVSHDVDVPLTFNEPVTDAVKKGLGDLYYRRSPGLMLRRLFWRFVHIFNPSFERDPNMNLDFIMDEEEKFGLRGTFNFIPIPGPKDIDSHYSLDNPAISGVLKRIDSRGFVVGFHPTYDSFLDPGQTKKEITILNDRLKTLNLSVAVVGRQHYLRWRPETWKIWNDIGMKEDGSVGYGFINGFRAGTCYKFSVFDLVQRKHLELVEEPLIFMDVNTEVNDSDVMLREVAMLAATCKKFGGNFTILYHNNYIISRKQKALFRAILREATR